ncbi:RCC1 domain-containing protein [Actinokineospora xionganensis]|uniref:Alpha-tubulin suppressor n=1 Tax=Actinokineospora xionganensis TaxID=2684470 RepID=A0ABR7L2C5_9PSEU|nr:hypothetical protein [Actinokineospora xionganensis]MBC6446840.1 hypothetical protein [Actinokineospora xionganensis]
MTVALTNGGYVDLFNNAGYTHLIVDLVGFHTPEFGSHFFGRTPQRIIDTRSGAGTPVSTTVSVPVEWPDYVTGALLNVTATQATTDTFVHAGSESGYSTSTLNLKPGQTVPNAAVAQVKSGDLMRFSNNAGTTHVIADVEGVFVGQGGCVSECAVAWGMGVNDSVGARPNAPKSAQLPVTGVSGVKAIASGVDMGYALKTDGTVVAWGANEYGQLGNGWTGLGSPMPVPVKGLAGVTQIAAGPHAGYALRDGTVLRWGRTPVYATARPFLTEVISGATKIAATETNGFALVDGQAYGWGSAHDGLLGVTYKEASAEPRKILGVTDMRDIAGGKYTAYAIKNDGSLWAWGSNRAGELGIGVACDSNTGQGCGSAEAVKVSGLTDVRAVSAALGRAYALLGDGSVWTWGTVGVCSGCASTTPVKMAELADVTQVAATPGGGYALRADGTVLGWGANHFGELANDAAGTFAGQPVVVGGSTGVTAVAGGRYAGYALTGA